jgi:iron complex transport system ATP-binding protein
MLQVNNISGGYRNNNNTIEKISFTVQQGEFIGIIGPNGSGKTTILKLLSGILQKSSGDIKLDNKRMEDYSTKQFAKKVAVLPQSNELSFAYTVKEVVQLGRFPFQRSFFNSFSKKDEDCVEEAMRYTEVTSFANKSYHELSGGEKQRVLLARAFAQEPQLLLLDEPANHLDIKHQIHLFSTLKKFTRKNRSAIAVFHDINMASLYCDRILVVNNGEIVKQMKTDQLDLKCLSEVFGITFHFSEHPVSNRKIVSFEPYINGK